MSDLKTFIDPHNEPSKDWLSVNKIERDRRAKEEESDKHSLEDTLIAPLLLKGHLLAFTQKVFALISSSHRKSMTLVIKEADLSLYLKKLKKCLFALQEQDLSHDPKFLKELSKAWYDCCHAVVMVEWLIRKKSPSAEGAKHFLDSIHNYTQGNGNPLGSYFTEETGEAWFPAPFMDLLSRLHHEFLESPHSSALHNWSAHIDKIVSSLDES